MEERRERVLTPSEGAAACRGRRHAGSRWRGTVAQCHGDSGKREQRACTQSAAPPSANAYAYKAPDGSSFGDMQFATDYNNGITYVMNVLSMWSSRVHKRVTRGQLCTIVYVQQQRDLAIMYGMMLAI